MLLYWTRPKCCYLWCIKHGSYPYRWVAYLRNLRDPFCTGNYLVKTILGDAAVSYIISQCFVTFTISKEWPLHEQRGYRLRRLCEEGIDMDMYRVKLWYYIDKHWYVTELVFVIVRKYNINSLLSSLNLMTLSLYDWCGELLTQLSNHCTYYIITRQTIV
jgi:hypothetical protein